MGHLGKLSPRKAHVRILPVCQVLLPQMSGVWLPLVDLFLSPHRGLDLFIYYIDK